MLRKWDRRVRNEERCAARLMLGFAFTVQVYCCTADDSDHQVFEKPWGIVILDRYGQIAKNNVTFDYQIHSGRGGESNALALLSVFDFSEEIIKDANTYLEYRL